MPGRGRPARRSRTDKSDRGAVAAQVLQAALREDVTLAELGGLARGEPTFAGRVLHWVNSAAFQRSRTVLDIDQATSILGVRGLRNVALGMVVAGLIPPEPRAQVLLVNGLRRALAARFVADHALHAQKDAAFTTGLFLEAGLLEHAHDQLDRVVSLAETPAMHRLVRERAEGLVPHPRSGRASLSATACRRS